VRIVRKRGFSLPKGALPGGGDGGRGIQNCNETFTDFDGFSLQTNTDIYKVRSSIQELLAQRS